VAATAGISRAQLANSPWPMFQHDPAHTGLSTVDTSGNPGLLKWNFEAAGIANPVAIPLVPSPAIGADGTIYVSNVGAGAYAPALYAINPDGTQKWAFSPLTESAPTRSTSPAIGADGTIYFGTSSTFGTGDFYAVNPDGSQKWDFTVGDQMGTAGAIGADGTIYIGSDKLHAINPNGTEKWAFKTAGAVQSAPAIGPGGVIYVGDQEYDSSGNPLPSHLYALEQMVVKASSRRTGRSPSGVRFCPRRRSAPPPAPSTSVPMTAIFTR
jgi:outer membrane protein assembly factor BamB